MHAPNSIYCKQLMLQIAVLQFFQSQNTANSGIQAPICLLHIPLHYEQIMEGVHMVVCKLQHVSFATQKS